MTRIPRLWDHIRDARKFTVGCGKTHASRSAGESRPPSTSSMCLLPKAEKKKKNLTDGAEYSAYPQHAERRLENSSCATSCSKSDGRAEISPTRGLKSRRPPPPRCPTVRICESMQCGRLKASYSNSWVGIMAWAWQIKTILKGRGGRRTLNGMTHGRAGGSFLFSLSPPNMRRMFTFWITAKILSFCRVPPLPFSPPSSSLPTRTDSQVHVFCFFGEHDLQCEFVLIVWDGVFC